MASIATEIQDGVLVIRMDRPPVNALDVETLDELSDCLERAEADQPRPAILTGTGSIFSAGADLKLVLEATPDDIAAGIKALSRCFRTLFVFSRPIVAAVNGYALAGGCVLTCGCDHRIMAESSGAIGAIESAAGVPFPAWALELMRAGMNNEHLQEAVLFGRMYEPSEALARGIVDEVVPAGDLMEKALDRARRLGEIPPVTYALTKAALREPSIERTDRRAAATDDEVAAAWTTPEVLAAIQKQLARLGG